MAKFRKMPVVIEAFRWGVDTPPDWFVAAAESIPPVVVFAADNVLPTRMNCVIKTLEGDMVGTHGDFIIQGVKGEIYPCKPDIFEATYEAVD